MWRISFLSALFSIAGITSVVASTPLPRAWFGDLMWLVLAGASFLAVWAFEGESG